MKKTYLQPTMMVVRLQQQSIICSSPVNRVSGNTDIGYGGGGKGPARARSHGSTGWDDDEGAGDEWE
jgi:hypothetical protein